MEHNGSYWKKWAGAFLFGVALITVYKTFDNLSQVFSAIGSFIGLLTPFIIGFILAFFLYPATIKVERLLEKSRKPLLVKRKKSLAVLAVYLVFIGVLAIVCSVFVPKLSASMAEFLKKIPWYFAQLEVFFTNLVKEGGFLDKLNMRELLDTLNLQSMLQNFLSRDIWSYLESVKGLTDTFFNIIMGVVIELTPF
ncbi:MAG: AI-2E family transporter [Clostridia bacterium]|nr:AI-2E family transporter [Clostridia bacterium]